MRFTIDRSDRSDRIMIKLIGELDMATAPQLTEAFEVLPTGPYHLVVDVSELSFIDSTGIKAMLDGKAFLEVQGLTMEVTRPTNRVRKVLDLLAVPGFLVINPDGKGGVKASRLSRHAPRLRPHQDPSADC